MHKLVGPRLPERRQVRLAQLSETFLQFIVGQSVNNDQTFALSLVGYRGYGKDLFGRAADLVKLVFDLDMGNHFSANLAEPGQAIGNPDESILIHRSDVTRLIPATTENLSGLFRTVQISLHDIWAAHLVGPRLPERGQVRLAQLSETFLQFIVGQSVNNDQTFALSLVGYRGYGKDLFGRAADLVKLVFDLDMANHFSANLAEPGQAIGNPDESILIHRSNVARVIPATTETFSRRVPRLRQRSVRSSR